MCFSSHVIISRVFAVERCISLTNSCHGMLSRVLLYRFYFDTTICTIYFSHLVVGLSLVHWDDFVNHGFIIRKKTPLGSQYGRLLKSNWSFLNEFVISFIAASRWMSKHKLRLPPPKLAEPRQVDWNSELVVGSHYGDELYLSPCSYYCAINIGKVHIFATDAPWYRYE